MISELRANCSARNLHEIHRGDFPFTFYEMVLRYAWDELMFFHITMLSLPLRNRKQTASEPLLRTAYDQAFYHGSTLQPLAGDCFLRRLIVVPLSWAQLEARERRENRLGGRGKREHGGREGGCMSSVVLSYRHDVGGGGGRRVGWV